MKFPLTVLGVEASCDDTSVALVRGAPEGPGKILSNEVAGQSAPSIRITAALFRRSRRVPMRNALIWWPKRRWTQPEWALAM